MQQQKKETHTLQKNTHTHLYPIVWNINKSSDLFALFCFLSFGLHMLLTWDVK